MSDALEELYRELGYKRRPAGPAPRAVARASAAAEAAVERAPAADAGDLPPASEADLAQFEELFRQDPAKIAGDYSRMVGVEITEEQLSANIAEARIALRQPAEYAASLRTRATARAAASPVPDAIRNKYPDIPVDPGRTKFEPHRDGLGWIIHCGPYKTAQFLRTGPGDPANRPPFPGHDAGRPFIYAMRDSSAQRAVRLALFSDFGTGEYYSRFIARALAELQPAPDIAVHLGDVYYSGTSTEVREHLQDVLEPLLSLCPVYVLNANHEMFSGGHAFFDYLRRKRQHPGPIPQEQDGSYFCLRSKQYQVIALDTAYDWWNDGKLGGTGATQIQAAWLRDQLAQGQGRRTILLTQHEPYDLGNKTPRPLLKQIQAHVAAARGSLDFWFWGDEHYSALFSSHAKAPFVGSCIGNGGHPIYWAEVKKKARKAGLVAPTWYDESPRFPGGTIRSEIGNNGFCVVDLFPGRVEVTYRSWLNEVLKGPVRF